MGDLVFFFPKLFYSFSNKRFSNQKNTFCYFLKAQSAPTGRGTSLPPLQASSLHRGSRCRAGSLASGQGAKAESRNPGRVPAPAAGLADSALTGSDGMAISTYSWVSLQEEQKLTLCALVRGARLGNPGLRRGFPRPWAGLGPDPGASVSSREGGRRRQQGPNCRGLVTQGT